MNDAVELPDNAEERALDLASQMYPSLKGDDIKCFIIISRGNLAFRYGPYPGPQAGAIATLCVKEKINFFITVDCSGKEFDWDLARDLRGSPEEKPPEAPVQAPEFCLECDDHDWCKKAGCHWRESDAAESASSR
jgi:hypothetical protein